MADSERAVIDLVLVKLLFAAAFLYVVAAYFRGPAGQSLFPTATTLFFLWQSLAFLGTLILTVWPNEGVGIFRLSCMLSGMTAFAAGAWVANRHARWEPIPGMASFLARPLIDDLKASTLYIAVGGIALVSIAVGIIYARQLGFSVVIGSLLQYMGSGDISSSQQLYSFGRKTIHGSSTVYLATGYASQFFAILLPLVLFLLYSRVLLYGRTVDKVVTALVALPTAYFLTLLGVRSLVLNAALIFVLMSTRRWGPFGTLTRPNHWWKVVLGLAVLFYFTITLISGRAGYSTSLAGVSFGAIEEFFTRVVLVASRNQLAFVQLVDPEPLANGRGWLSSLEILLPGWHEGLASQLADALYGNSDSSAPPDFWSSAWWNFGFLGVTLVPFLAAYLIQRYTVWFFRGKKSTVRIVTVYVSFFVFREITEPIVLFNRGFVTLLIFLGIVAVVKNAERSARFEHGSQVQVA